MEYQKIIRKDGCEFESIPAFTPTLEGDLAIVHLDVLKKLTDLLPTTSFHEIRRGFIYDFNESDNLEEAVKLCKDFIAFNETVNMIKTFEPYAMDADVDDQDGCCNNTEEEMI